MDVYENSFDPDQLDDVEPESDILFTWKGNGMEDDILTLDGNDDPYELFPNGGGDDRNLYTISNNGTTLTVLGTVPDGDYFVRRKNGTVKATINVKRVTI